MGDADRNRLEEIRNAQAPDFLINIFRNGNEEERSAAVEAYAQLPSTEYDAKFIAACKDPDENVRRCVAAAIGKSEYYFFMHQLVSMLEDPSVAVRDASHSALKEMLAGPLASKLTAAHLLESGTLKDALINMMKSGPEAARETAYQAFSELLDEKPMLDMLSRELEKAKGKDERGRLEPFVQRARLAFQLANAGLDERDMRVLAERGLVFKDRAARRRRSFPMPTTPRPQGKKAFAN